MKLLNLATPITNKQIHKESEGEEFLKDFFDEVGIKYRSEEVINALKGDYKQYRITDFYLPQYKIYVEFLDYGIPTILKSTGGKWKFIN